MKTYKKDFNGLIKKSELFDENSDLRKSFSYHENDKFMISKKVNIDKDEIGRIEYRAFIYKGNIMNVSRNTDTIYHKIPKDVLLFIENVIKKLPKGFPTTFCLDIFSYDNKLDILEFNPLAASGRYLYNSIFNFGENLNHESIKQIPEEKNIEDLFFESDETLEPTTTINIEKSFAKDYDDIKKTGDRFVGFIHINGKSDYKINLSDLMGTMQIIDSDEMFVCKENNDEDEIKKELLLKTNK